MSTPTIQLAFQGGGAKLAAMLPIAHAFREAERDGFICISRVSGTSAGAVCAALVATQADFEAARRYITSHGPAHLGALVPKRLKLLAERSKRGRRLGFWNLVKDRRMFLDVAIAGQPLLNSIELKSFIAGVHKAGHPEYPQVIEKCPVQLIITASDVVSSTGILHERGDIVAAIEDSCSLPVLLRSFSSLAKSHYVDGGLCDNLPVDCLLSDSRNPIFAIFPEVAEERRSNTNILSYFVSLLSASINHNVHRSISMVGNPYRFPAKTDIDLLDFERAVADLQRDDWYKLAFDDAMERIKSFSKSYGFALSQSQARVVDSVDVDQFRTTLSNLTSSKPGQSAAVHCMKGRFIVRINHDRRIQPAAQTIRRTPDTITRVSRLRILGNDFRYYRATVNVAEDSIVPTIWSARNVTRDIDIPIAALPLNRDNVAGVPMRHCLLEFIDPDRHVAVGDVIELQSTYHSLAGSDMRRLNMGQPDHFGFTNGTGVSIDEADLVLIYPKSLGDIQLHLDPKRSAGLSAEPRYFNPLLGENLPMDIGQTAVGISVKNMDLQTAFFATAVPV